MVQRLIFGFIAAIVLQSGCKNSPEEYLLPAPRRLELTASGEDSLSIRLTWDFVDEAYRYVVTLNGLDLAMVAETTWVHESPEELGVYQVFSHRDERRSTLSAMASDTLLSDADAGPIFGSAVSDTNHPGGFVWTASGEGVAYSLTRPDSVDLYFETQDPPGSSDLADIAELYPPRSSIPIESHSRIAHSPTWEFDEIEVVPEADFYARLPAEVGWTYVVNTRGRFVKLEITEHDTLESSLRFRYVAQPVPGFKRLAQGE
jgi:hypothetical protein